MDKPIIEVKGLSKRYRLGAIGATRLRDDLTHLWHRLTGQAEKVDEQDFWALKDVSFDVQPGEVLGIIGRNGAGKSTLLKILSRITDPTAGEVVVRGRIASLLEVGTGFHPDLSGRENIFLNGAILGMTSAEVRKKMDEIVAFSEIEKFLDTPVKRYSSGMYVRLAFAVAAHLDPEILVVDEVLAVGDAQFQKKCVGKMGEGKKNGVTTLIVSHNMAVINNLCDRAVLLDAGIVELDGPPAEVTQQYMSRSTTASGQIIWSDATAAPGNDVVRLHAVRICQEGNSDPIADVDISKEVHIEIEYWNMHSGVVLYPAIWLKDQIGTFILASSNHHSISLTRDPWYGCPYPAGLYRSKCSLPANFLNEGTYCVTAIVGKDVCDTQILIENVVSFHVHDTGEMRKEYMGRWVGPVIRPRLAWNTRPLTATASTLQPAHTS